MTDVVELQKAFADKYHHIVDDVMDPEKFAAELFADGATFQIGNMPKATNPSQIAAGAKAIYDMVKALKHNVKEFHSLGPGIIMMLICY